jgi:hypothetical protein
MTVQVDMSASLQGPEPPGDDPSAGKATPPRTPPAARPRNDRSRWRRLAARLRSPRRRRSRFILEVETEHGWRPVTLFRRPDEARSQLAPVSGMMPHLRLRVSKDFGPEVARIERHRAIALAVKIVSLGVVAALFVILFMAWLTG